VDRRAFSRQPDTPTLRPVRHALRKALRAPRTPPSANPSSEVADPFWRLPLSTLLYEPRGCSPWRPDAVIGTTAAGFFGKSRRVSWTAPCAPEATSCEGPLPACECKRILGQADCALARIPVNRKGELLPEHGAAWRLLGVLPLLIDTPFARSVAPPPPARNQDRACFRGLVSRKKKPLPWRARAPLSVASPRAQYASPGTLLRASGFRFLT